MRTSLHLFVFECSSGGNAMTMERKESLSRTDNANVHSLPHLRSTESSDRVKFKVLVPYVTLTSLVEPNQPINVGDSQ